MNLHGYCIKCHKIKLVRVQGLPSGVPAGVCRDCEEKT